jgi:hypothetical protein
MSEEVPSQELDPEEVAVEDVVAEAVNLSNSSVKSVQAELARVGESFVLNLDGNEVEVNESFVGQLMAQEATLQNSGAASVQGESVNLSNGGVAFVQAAEASLHGCRVLAVAGQNVVLSESPTGAVFASTVQSPAIQTRFLLAGRVEGNVETLVDTRQVALGGLLAGAAIGLILLVLRLLTGRNR